MPNEQDETWMQDVQNLGEEAPLVPAPPAFGALIRSIYDFREVFELNTGMDVLVGCYGADHSSLLAVGYMVEWELPKGIFSAVRRKLIEDDRLGFWTMVLGKYEEEGDPVFIVDVAAFNGESGPLPDGVDKARVLVFNETSFSYTDMSEVEGFPLWMTTG